MFVSFSWLNATAENFLLKAKETPDTKLVLGKPEKKHILGTPDPDGHFGPHQMGTLPQNQWTFQSPCAAVPEPHNICAHKTFRAPWPKPLQHYRVCMSTYNCLNDDNTWIINNTTTHAIIQLTMLSVLGHRNIPPCKACGIAPSVKAGCCYRARLSKLLLEMLMYITPTNNNYCIIMLTECTPNHKTLPPITAKWNLLNPYSNLP